MPELPEVETMVRGIRSAVTGQQITDLQLCECTCRPLMIVPDFPIFREAQVGRTVTQITRLGKRILLNLDDETAIAIEPRMTGLMLVTDPPTRNHLRLHWQFQGPAGDTGLWFWDRRGLGTATWHSKESLLALRETRLGPDALSLDAAAWQFLCQRTTRPIKVAILEQKLVAGIGNLYASEILHRAKISPFLPSASLAPRQISRLAEATQHILQEAIRYEGSTLGDGTYRNALNKDGSYQNAHRVYMKAGQPCQQCRRGIIERVVQAQRSTFYCPNCQKTP